MIGITLFLVLQAPSAQPEPLISAVGWSVPGLAEIASRKKPDTAWTQTVHGVEIHGQAFRALDPWVSPVALALLDGSTATPFRGRPHSAIRYLTPEGRVFAYRVEVTPFVEPGPSGEEGIVGALYTFALYDMDGDGRFEMLESVNPIVSPGKPPAWELRLPEELIGGPLPSACGDGGPLIAMLVSPGLDPRPMGVLVAIWSDGRIVKAKDGLNPENGRVEGRLDAATTAAVYRSLKQRGTWQWKSPPLVFDARELRTSVCSEGARLKFSHQPPDAASKPATDLAAYLLSLEVLDAKPTDALGLSSIESWMPWFRSRD